VRARVRWLVGVGTLLAASGAGATSLPPLVLSPQARVIVFAPHPDDETIAAGGLLHALARSGQPLRVVVLTNGDGYPRAVTGGDARRAPSAAEYAAFGALRQDEARRALARLGVAPASVSFLGFPDGGLADLWQSHWASRYTSPFTQWDRPRYPGAADAQTPYEGRHLTAALARELREFRPTVVVLPHPDDAHLDHAHAGRFVVEALTRLEASGALAHRPAVLGYVVHYGPGTSWPPSPPDADLPPPPGLRHASWVELRLDADAVAAKRAAVAEYPSQLRVLGTFLRSFVTPNELYARIDPHVLARIASIH
jgi:LmbE family N-acetylglucosaminyl deacetylase